MAIRNPDGLIITTATAGIPYTKEIDSIAGDFAGLSNDTRFYDITTGLVHYKDPSGNLVSFLTTTPYLGDATGNSLVLADGLTTNALTITKLIPDSLPSAPSAGNKKLYTRSINGISTLMSMGSGGNELTFFQDNTTPVFNSEVGSLTRGQAIRSFNQSGGRIGALLAKADTEVNSQVHGLVISASIASGSTGLVQFTGIVINMDTSMFSAGDTVYLSESTPGALTNVRPSSPNFTTKIGLVLTSHATTGSINLDIINTSIDLRLESSSAPISGFGLTNNGDGTVNIASGVADLRSTNSETGLLARYLISAVTNLALTDNVENFILADYNGGSPTIVVVTDPLLITTTTNTLIYGVARYGSTIKYFSLGHQSLDFNGKLRRRFLNTEAFTHSSGAMITSSNRKLIITAGLFYAGLEPVLTPAFNTSVADTFTLVYNNGSTWTRTTGQTDINNTQYNVAGVLTALNSNKFRVDYVYEQIDSPTTLYVVLGSTEYVSEVAAELDTIPTVLPVELQRLGILVGRVIVQEGATTITEKSAFEQIFSSSGVINHNDTGGIQGGTASEYYHLTSAEYTGTGTGNFVKETAPTLTNPVVGTQSVGDNSTKAASTAFVTAAVKVLTTRVTHAYTAFTAAGLSESITSYTLPAKAILLGVSLKDTTAFAGTGITAYTLEVGIVGETTRYLEASNVFSAVSDTKWYGGGNFDGQNYGAGTTIQVTARSVGGNLSAGTAGSADIDYVILQLP